MPTLLNATGVGATAIRVRWTRPDDDGGRPISMYRVMVDGLPALTSDMLSSDTTMLLIRGNGLMQNTTYT